MVGKGRPGFFVLIVGILMLILLTVAATGCGSKKESGEAGEKEEAQKIATDSTPQETSPQEYVFSTTVSADTKTENFQVKTGMQTLYYNLVGDKDASVTIMVYSPDGKAQAGANALEPGQHQKTLYLRPGTYYMEIRPSHCTVEVKLQD
ncbi:MAG: hypothetical protein WHT46_07985 [Candidatus Geothermincolales bacterium]